MSGKGPIQGSTTLNTFFTNGGVEEGDIVTATFTTKDETFTDIVEVGPQPVSTGVNRKVFVWIDRATQDGFSFAIYASTLNQVPDANRTVTITDIPSTGVKVDCATIRMQMAPTLAGPLGPSRGSPRPTAPDLSGAHLAERLHRRDAQYPGGLPRAGQGWPSSPTPR